MQGEMQGVSKHPLHMPETTGGHSVHARGAWGCMGVTYRSGIGKPWGSHTYKLVSSQPLSTEALECEIALQTKVVESLPECQATFSTEQIELVSEFEKAWSIVSNRALP
jgi:hypothetical protein